MYVSGPFCIRLLLFQRRINQLSCLQRVHCMRGHTVPRGMFQDWLSASNPQWKAFVDNLEKTGQKIRTNPDGDVRPSFAD